MEYSYKFRLYPNTEQENFILRTLGCCRYVYNHYLALRKQRYEQTGGTLGYVGSPSLSPPTAPCIRTTSI